jgi:hypothetical protein
VSPQLTPARALAFDLQASADRLYRGFPTLSAETSERAILDLRRASLAIIMLHKSLEETLRALEAHLDEDTLHANLKHRDFVCPCNANEVARARGALSLQGIMP